MHELSLAQGIVDIVQDEAERQSFASVKSVIVEVGALSCVDAHALKFGFESVTIGTVAEKAKLIIETKPGYAHCFSCGEQVTVSDRASPCPNCGSHQLIINEGEELRVKELEVH